MKLTMRLKKRWITSVLRETNSPSVPMPWQRGTRRNLSISRRASARPSLVSLAHG